MTKLALRLARHLPARLLLTAVLAAASSLAPHATAQAPASRIAGDIASNERTALPNSLNPRANAKFDAGRLASTTRLEGVSIHFSRTQAQEAALHALIAEQQDPASPQYHQWLSPEQFAARFGISDADLDKVQGWLERQGFSIDSVNRSKNAIHFSGTVAQVESAFSTEIHSYNVPMTTGVEKHFSPSTPLSVPQAMAGVVQSVRNLDDFRPHTHLAKKNGQPKPKFTLDSNGTQYLFFAPGDIQTVYDVNNVKSSYTGTGQTITIVGQSQVSTTDLDAFWSAAGVTRQDPTMFLVPGSGNQTVVADGDEAESDLDLEWSGAIANGASLDFVYTGNNSNYSAFDSIQYAIDQKIGTIISSSYGDCETDLGTQNVQTLESVLEQATAQGQTLMSAAGDDGSTDCFEDTNLNNTTEEEALAVDYPASSPNVTGVGGTEISQASTTYETAGSEYWTAASTANPIVTSSALIYIPEQAWNEDPLCLQNATTASQVLCAGGGGASALFTTKPSWQAGVPGIPQDGKRDVPDLALAASIFNPGYLFCTSDPTFWDTTDGQTGSCASGSFFDSTDSFLTSAGGTSFATPIFAGMVALINQKQGYTTGQGLINPTLYTLASNSTTYASAFHDITSGSNACDATGYCSSQGESGFSAGTGYDQATGLGSVDLFNLAAAWPTNTSSTAALIGTTTTVSAASTTPTINTSDTFTITVAPVTGTTIPTGTVTITVDTDTPVTGTLTSNGTYTYTTSFSTSGSHTVEVSYPSNAIYAGSTGSITVNVPVPVSGKGTFTLSATNITVAQGSVGSSTVTVTPAGGYTGTVEFSLSTTSTDLQNDTCPNLNNIGVSSTAAATGTLTIDTNAANCQATGAARKRSGQVIHAAGLGSGKTGPMTAIGVLAGLLLAGYLGRNSGKLRMLAGFILLATLGMAFTGCGGSSSTSIPNAPKGTYTLTLTGTDVNTSTITATTTFTLTIN